MFFFLLFRMQNRVCTTLATYLHAVVGRQFVISVGFEICFVSTTASPSQSIQILLFSITINFRSVFYSIFHTLIFHFCLALLTQYTFIIFAVVSTSSRLPLVSGTALSGAGSAANTTAAAPTFPGELEELQSVLHFPEEVALRITDAEYQLFYQVRMKIAHRHTCLARPREKRSNRKNQFIISRSRLSQQIYSWIIMQRETE